MIVLPQPSCHNRLKSLNSFSVGLLWRSTLYLARARPLQGLYLVRRGRPQPGVVRPPQAGIAPPASTGGKGEPSYSACPALLATRFRRFLPLLKRESAPVLAETALSSGLSHR